MIVVENEKGFMSAYVRNSVCMVDNFYVKSQYRGSPAAYRIVNKIIQIAQEMGCHTFCAETYKIDPAYAANLRLNMNFGMCLEFDTPYKTVTSKYIGTVPC